MTAAEALRQTVKAWQAAMAAQAAARDALARHADWPEEMEAADRYQAASEALAAAEAALLALDVEGEVTR